MKPNIASVVLALFCGTLCAFGQAATRNSRNGEIGRYCHSPRRSADGCLDDGKCGLCDEGRSGGDETLHDLLRVLGVYF